MENHTENPAGKPTVSESQIILPQRVARGYVFPDFGHAPVMGKEVEEGEEDRGGLLHSQKAVEWPFAVELIDWLEVRWVAGETLGRNHMLASVIAFGGTVPEEETVLERFSSIH